jgi:hypothetical protein
MKRLYAARDVELASPYIFVHPRGTRHAGKPVLDVKNAFGTALEEAELSSQTFCNFAREFPSCLRQSGPAWSAPLTRRSADTCAVLGLDEGARSLTV